eukprot:m.91093 g.91093  ORF g.91093 m.91093 type:complete len:485 (-) comp8863_c0_seq3:3084-4538(-)
MSARSRSKELQKQAQKLSVENDVMEKRLLELKKSLRKQKEDRKAKGGYQWRSGGKGKMSGHASVVLETSTSGNRRRHMPQPPVSSSAGKERGFRRAMPHPPSEPRKATKSAGVTPSSISSSLHSTLRGFQQSSRGPQLLADDEEDWRSTNTTNGLAQGDVYDEAKQAEEFRRAVEEWRKGATVTTEDTPVVAKSSSSAATMEEDPSYPLEPETGGGMLLQGPDFDEGESHASFVEAVQQWREGRKKYDEKKRWNQGNTLVNKTKSSEIQADNDDVIQRNVTPDISFKPNLTYLEKLMLKKKRSTPTPSRAQSRVGAEDDLDASYTNTIPVNDLMKSALQESKEEGLIDFYNEDNRYDEDDDVIPMGDVDANDMDDYDNPLLRQINSLSLSQHLQSVPNVQQPSSFAFVEMTTNGNDDIDDDVANNSDDNVEVYVEEPDEGPHVDEPSSDGEDNEDSVFSNSVSLHAPLNAGVTVKDAMDDLLNG